MRIEPRPEFAAGVNCREGRLPGAGPRHRDSRTIGKQRSPRRFLIRSRHSQTRSRKPFDAFGRAFGSGLQARAFGRHGVGDPSAATRRERLHAANDANAGTYRRSGNRRQSNQSARGTGYRRCPGSRLEGNWSDFGFTGTGCLLVGLRGLKQRMDRPKNGRVLPVADSEPALRAPLPPDCGHPHFPSGGSVPNLRMPRSGIWPRQCVQFA